MCFNNRLNGKNRQLLNKLIKNQNTGSVQEKITKVLIASRQSTENANLSRVAYDEIRDTAQELLKIKKEKTKLIKIIKALQSNSKKTLIKVNIVWLAVLVAVISNVN